MSGQHAGDPASPSSRAGRTSSDSLSERAPSGSLIGRSESKGRRRPDPKCPLRPGEPCTLCQYDVSGPHDCPLVYLVMDDPVQREEWVASRKH